MTTDPLLTEYLTEDKAAAELGVCIRTLRLWRDMGQGPVITRLGRRIFYRRSTLGAWIASREERAAA